VPSGGLRDPVPLHQNECVQSNRKVLLLVSALFVVVAVVAGVGVWRVESSLDKDKVKMLALADEFMGCLYREDVACLELVSVWDEPALRDSLTLARQVQSQLGARGKSAPIKGNAWSMRKFSSLTAGVSTTLRVTLTTSYERDPNVREWFELIEKNGMLRMRNFRVNSPKLLEQAKLSQ
jgi:hypothetical protein